MTGQIDPVLRPRHFTWHCKDAEETRAFYEDLLGMPLPHVPTAFRARAS
jgi:catechol 2,3-dioxygenase-like lactoylglutathione lyase family enzyme